jgi:hypothetical protein
VVLVELALLLLPELFLPMLLLPLLLLLLVFLLLEEVLRVDKVAAVLKVDVVVVLKVDSLVVLLPLQSSPSNTLLSSLRSNRRWFSASVSIVSSRSHLTELWLEKLLACSLILDGLLRSSLA